MDTTTNTDRTKETRAQAIGEQIADLMRQLEAVHPGSTSAHNGRITGLGITIRQIGGQWTATAG